MDLVALRSRVRSLANVLIEEVLPEADLDLYINEAYQGLCVSAPWSFRYAEETLATVAGQELYALPGSLVEVSWVSSPDDGPRRLLRRRRADQLERFPDHRADQAVPWGWANAGDGQLRLFPAPDAVYSLTVAGWTVPAALSAGTDEPVFADEFHPVVAYEAARQVLQREAADDSRAERFLAQVGWWVSRMATRYLPDGESVAWPPELTMAGGGDA